MTAEKLGCDAAASSCRVERREEIVPRRLLIGLVHRRHHVAIPIRAKANVVTARRAKARIVEELRARDHQLHRSAEPPRRDRGEHRLDLQRVLLAESAAGERARSRESCSGDDSQRVGETLSNRFDVLRALVNRQRVAVPLGHGRDQLDGVLVLRRAAVDRVHCTAAFDSAVSASPATILSANTGSGQRRLRLVRRSPRRRRRA